MSKFRSAHRTIVTEIKSFIVDTVSRSGVFRQTVSARVPDDGTLRQQDVNVSKTKTFEVLDTHAAVGILCPEPVKIIMIQTGEVEIPEEPEEPELQLGEIVAPAALVAGRLLTVSVTDPDLPAAQLTLDVTVFNTTTGETETLSLNRMSNRTFTGSMQTMMFPTKGEDFDGSMNVAHDQLVRVIYRDLTTPTANVQTVEATIPVISPYVDSRVTANSFIFPDRPIAIMVEDKDVAGAVAAYVTVTNINTGEVEVAVLTEIQSGVFTAELPTRLAEFPQTDDGVLDVSVGDTLVVEFTDERAIEEPTKTVEVEVREDQSVAGLMSIQEEATVTTNLSVTAYDYNLAGQPYIIVPISNVRTSSVIMLECYEVQPNTGIFFGQLQLKQGNTSGQILGVEVGDTLRCVYVDSNNEHMPVFVERYVTIVEDAPVDPPVVVPPEEDEEEDPPESILGAVEIKVNGLFFFNGEFTGRIRIVGLKDELTRCSILHV